MKSTSIINDEIRKKLKKKGLTLKLEPSEILLILARNTVLFLFVYFPFRLAILKTLDLLQPVFARYEDFAMPITICMFIGLFYLFLFIRFYELLVSITDKIRQPQIYRV